MITVEQIKEALSGKQSYNFDFSKTNDPLAVAINLLRARIPLTECRSIVGAAEHDVVYLCDIKTVAKFLNEEDLLVLVCCNCSINDDCLIKYV